MKRFNRSIDMKIIEKLRDEPLFTECLLPDILDGEVFPTIAYGDVYFYYKGQYPYVYMNGKFVATLSRPFQAPMATQQDYLDAYWEIMALNSLFAMPVQEGVSELYKFSFASYLCEWYFVLDTAIELLDDDLDRLMNLLLMDAHTGKLLFVAVQHYADMKLPPEKEVKNIADELERYRDQIATHRDAILDWYGEYTQTMAALTGIEIPAPTGVCDDCGLLIYGFDEDQKNGKLRKIMDSLTKMGWPVYAVEDIGDVTPETLFKALAGEKG